MHSLCVHAHIPTLQEDDADEEDDTETPHSVGGGTPNGPLQHHKSSRPSSLDAPDNMLGRSPLRSTTSNAAGSMALDGETGALGRSARMKVGG